MTNTLLPRSLAIEKCWSNFDWAALFAAIVYPLLGLFALIGAVAAGLLYEGLTLRWWHLPIALAVGAGTLVICNFGIGVLHRVWQHKAGELRWPAQVLTAVNCVIAMQGQLKDWINYHSQHHSMTDRPGDPHNPAEGRLWAWVGWLLFRDRNDSKRPLAMWLRDVKTVTFFDRNYYTLTLLVHFVVPAVVYATVWAFGGSLVLAVILHATAVTMRGVQFHATTLGVNVLGHLKTPAWAQWTFALLTGGEALHAHHHDFPRSALHLPRKGLINRLVDYNGTLLLLFSKLRLAVDLEIAPMFMSRPENAAT